MKWKGLLPAPYDGLAASIPEPKTFRAKRQAQSSGCNKPWRYAPKFTMTQIDRFPGLPISCRWQRFFSGSYTLTLILLLTAQPNSS